MVKHLVAKPAKTEDELRVQAYNLVVSHDSRTPINERRSDTHWFRIKSSVKEALVRRGTLDTLDINGVVSQVIENYRAGRY